MGYLPVMHVPRGHWLCSRQKARDNASHKELGHIGLGQRAAEGRVLASG